MPPPERDPGAPIWAVTSYYNPAGYRRRLANYRLFRQHLQLPLLTIEWSPTGEFELQPGDADMLIQLDGGDVMWQKERLLNIGVARLPAQCTHVAWLDCDVVFENPAWPEQALERLEDALLVQLFDRVVHLKPTPLERLRIDASWRDSGVMSERVGFARMYCDAKSSGDWSSLGMLPAGQPFSTPGSNGHAWAAHRSLLQQYPLFDAWVVGGGDFAFTYAAAGRSADFVHRVPVLSGAHAAHYLEQARQLEREIDGRIACVAGMLRHLWHGDPAHRHYMARHSILTRHGFDPNRFLQRSPSGVWEWAGAPQGLPEEVRAYFERRKEDGREASGA